MATQLVPTSCSVCGMRNLADARFCDSVRSQFSPPTCSQCGSSVTRLGAQFCEQCGARLNRLRSQHFPDRFPARTSEPISREYASTDAPTRPYSCRHC